MIEYFDFDNEIIFEIFDLTKIDVMTFRLNIFLIIRAIFYFNRN